ncbi:hypothetical protein [Mesorhizobium sp. 113-1-2]|uniref:hypothetical protein n=1 Tax=Mesorhizobium sp. 113-1-2 TaxID=2744515 RepID=UPI0019256AB8|nr:hypothetical protein [Mesorhizobium sp. 113-1-2]
MFGSIGIRLSLQLSLLFLLFAAACAGLIGYQLSNIDETARTLRLQRQAHEISQALRLANNAAPTLELPAERLARYQGDFVLRAPRQHGQPRPSVLEDIAG